MAKLSSQKQTAVDALVREAIGTAAVVGLLHSRYTGKGPHQLYLLDNGHTVFVNLAAGPVTARLSKKPNAKAQAAERKREARQEARLERKAAREAKKAAKAAARKEGQ